MGHLVPQGNSNIIGRESNSKVPAANKNFKKGVVKVARNSLYFPQTSFTNSFPNTVWFIVAV